MALVSMTGFAFAEVKTAGFVVGLDLKSYNNRYLDLFVTLPPALASLEPGLRDQLAGKAVRGRVELTVRLKDAPDAASVVDAASVAHAREALEGVARAAGFAASDVTLDHVLSWPGLLRSGREVDAAAVGQALDQALPGLLAAFAKARATEGARLEADVRRQLELIEDGRAFIASQAAGLEAQFQASLRRKFDELSAEVDEGRLLAETALLLIRYGINEELVRLAAHREAFLALLAEGGAVGKKLDFLCQEFGREINTIGSKTTSHEVQQRVVVLKDALENIREQLRNVE